MLVYIVLFLFLLLFEYAYFILAKRLRIVDRPHHQSSHTGIIVRGGGIIFYVSFLLWSIANNYLYYGGLIGITILAVISFIDDIHNVSPKIRLICQIIAMMMMFYHSGLIQANYYVIILLTMACVGAVNIYNFMDGINGMTGGYSLIVSLALLYVNVFHVNFIKSSLIIFIIISILVFNMFNFKKKAICFAGDVGSLSIGFILVFLVLRLAINGHSMSWIAMLSVYLVDGGMTIMHRILLRENLMKPHKKHAYQIMANELKMPHLVVSGIYMGLQAICCTIYILWPGYPSFYAIFGTLIMMYLMFMKKYYYLHVKNC